MQSSTAGARSRGYDTKNACEGDQNGAYMCHDFGPWAVSNTLAYGFAAVNMGGDYCGKCYQIEFSGTSHSAANDPGAQSLKGKTMIVQAINTGGVDGTQFDLLIPGGGVGLGAPDNPNLTFKEATCPSTITQMSGLKR